MPLLCCATLLRIKSFILSTDIMSAFAVFFEALWHLYEAKTSGQEGWNKCQCRPEF